MIKKLRMYLIIFIVFMIFFYIMLIISGKKLQNISTFPQTWFEKINISWVEKIELNNWNKKVIWIYLDNNKEKTIFYFHWNGGNLNIFKEIIKNIWNLWYNVLCYDYPWYGESEGYPTEENIYKSSEIFYDYLIDEKKEEKEDIIIYGYSIWAAVATDLAYKKNINKLILMSPFTSRYWMWEYMLGFNLQKILFLENSFISEEKIKNIKAETLVIHWKKDKLIPFYMWEKIYKNSWAKEKYFIAIEKAWHNNISYQYEKELNPYIISFLEWKAFKNKIIIK